MKAFCVGTGGEEGGGVLVIVDVVVFFFVCFFFTSALFGFVCLPGFCSCLCGCSLYGVVCLVLSVNVFVCLVFVC